MLQLKDITAERVRWAYKKTGRKPCLGAGFAYNNTACALQALGLVLGVSWRAVLPEEESVAFIHGFDGKRPEEDFHATLREAHRKGRYIAKILGLRGQRIGNKKKTAAATKRLTSMVARLRMDHAASTPGVDRVAQVREACQTYPD